MAYKYPFSTTDEQTKLAVWAKGNPIQGYDPAIWRHDICGAVMKYADHGNTNSKHGWEIDHIYPQSLGGQTEWDNLQPLYWENNRAKSDRYPWKCGT